MPELPYVPDWMRGDPHAEGVRAGIMMGQAILNAKTQRQQLQQQAQEFPLKLRGLELQNDFAQKSFDARLAIQKSTADINSLKLDQARQEVEMNRLDNQAMADLGDTALRISSTGEIGTDVGEMALDGLIARHPGLADTPQFKALRQRQSVSRMAKDRLQVSLDIAKARAAATVEAAQVRNEGTIEAAKIRAGVGAETADQPIKTLTDDTGKQVGWSWGKRFIPIAKQPEDAARQRARVIAFQAKLANRQGAMTDKEIDAQFQADFPESTETPSAGGAAKPGDEFNIGGFKVRVKGK